MKEIVIILQGGSGSGKTTFAKRWDLETRYTVSADHFFEELAALRNTSYKDVFDPRLLSEAHEACFKNYADFLTGENELNISTLIVDNTNIHLWEMAPYVALAKAYGWDVEVHTFHCPPHIAAARNKHGVPVGVCKRMVSELEKPLPFWGEHFEHHLEEL